MRFYMFLEQFVFRKKPSNILGTDAFCGKFHGRRICVFPNQLGKYKLYHIRHRTMVFFAGVDSAVDEKGARPSK